jgi:Kef-type K+ transport system membrane component KefB
VHLDIVGSPVLGYLAAGVLIGPYGLSIIHHVRGTKAIAEFGFVFLLFNIGLEVQAEWLLRFFHLSGNISLTFCVCSFNN